MHVVWRANDHSVNLLVQRIEHLTVIAETLGVGVRFERVSRSLLIHIAERNNVFTFNAVQIVGSTSADADESDIQPLVWGASPQHRRQLHRRNTGHA